MIDKKTVEHIAELARLNLTEDEEEKFAKELSKILEAFSEIKQANTGNIKPSFQPIEVKNVLREDKPEESLSQEDALANAEQKEDKLFKGPKAV